MAECFCGCGRKVGLRRRGVNKQGLRTVGLLAKLREAREIEARLSAEGEADEALQELIEEGERFRAFWVAILHDYEDILARLSSDGDSLRDYKRDWERWGREGMLTCRALGVPISRLGAFTGRV